MKRIFNTVKKLIHWVDNYLDQAYKDGKFNFKASYNKEDLIKEIRSICLSLEMESVISENDLEKLIHLLKKKIRLLKRNLQLKDTAIV
ncbi:hypothetical protein JOD45_002856 [Scopulibacillus daqui]|uniref:Uncharacterized protein n=1 Tax=Scopulibacillus daqui TaxID=1469162 RepID=A0ABS2Q4K1_9BACL|nr:hypothetical protein [Scopulibacillus daqui]MBM7646624.1 hypothetical protein [Scopulibacillus daqui]